jgi:hypothetical protein
LAVDLIGPINPTTRNSKARYIITAIDYLTCWAKATTVQDYSIDTTSRFILRILSLDLDVLGVQLVIKEIILLVAL